VVRSEIPQADRVELTLNAAANLRDLRAANVEDRREEGLIRTHPATRGSAKHLVYLDEFDEDIAALRCRCGCGRAARNASAWADQGCSRRKYPVEIRTCPVCGEEFELLGCYARRERQGEPCCGDTCEAEYRWRGGPEAFGRPAKGGTHATCAADGCGREFYRYPSRPDQQFCPDHADEARAAWHESEAAKAEHERGRERIVEWQAETFPALVKAKKAELRGIDTARAGEVSGHPATAVASYWIKKRGAPAERVTVGRRRTIYILPAREFAGWTGDPVVWGRLNAELDTTGSKRGPKVRISTAQEDQIRELTSKGRWGRDEIARRVGVSPKQVRRVQEQLRQDQGR
jgi:hypothetical protein